MSAAGEVSVTIGDWRMSAAPLPDEGDHIRRASFDLRRGDQPAITGRLVQRTEEHDRPTPGMFVTVATGPESLRGVLRTDDKTVRFFDHPVDAFAALIATLDRRRP